MPTINNKKICNKCRTFYTTDRCPNCHKQDNKQYTKYLRAKDRNKIYNCKRWKDLREVALVRDNLMCVHCKDKAIDTKATEVHHIIYLEDDISLAYDLDNLVSLCSSCHQKVHANDKDRHKRFNF